MTADHLMIMAANLAFAYFFWLTPLDLLFKLLLSTSIRDVAYVEDANTWEATNVANDGMFQI